MLILPGTKSDFVSNVRLVWHRENDHSVTLKFDDTELFKRGAVKHKGTISLRNSKLSVLWSALRVALIMTDACALHSSARVDSGTVLDSVTPLQLMHLLLRESRKTSLYGWMDEPTTRLSGDWPSSRMSLAWVFRPKPTVGQTVFCTSLLPARSSTLEITFELRMCLPIIITAYVDSKLKSM